MVCLCCTLESSFHISGHVLHPLQTYLQPLCWIFYILPMNFKLIDLAFICSFRFFLYICLRCIVVNVLMCSHTLFSSHNIVTQSGSSSILQCVHVYSITVGMFHIVM